MLQIEMILQASEYESSQGSELQEFFDSTAGKWRTEIGRSWAEEICKRRGERSSANNSDAPVSS
jgi:putative hydrolase of HD superfamily